MRVVVRCLLCLIITVFGWKLTQAMTEEQAMSALGDYSSDCDPKPTEEDLKNIVQNEKEVPRSTKCVRLCLANKMNVLKDCKIDTDNLYSAMQILYDDKEEEIREMATVCNGKITCTDECDAAHDYAMCLLNEIETRGWKMVDFNF